MMRICMTLLALMMLAGCGGAQAPPVALGASAPTAPAAPAMSVAQTPKLASEVIPIEGVYKVTGGDARGQYIGVAEVTRRGDRGAYAVAWTTYPDENYVGVGIREGNILSVAIRSAADPRYLGIVVYTIAPGPKLNGRWTTLGSGGELIGETLVLESAKAE